MTHLCLTILLAILLLAAPVAAAESEVLNTDQFMAGISVILWNDDTTMDVNAPAFFDDLERRELGVESIIFTFPIYQDGVCATELYEDPVLTPSEEAIRIFIREAHSRGRLVWLKPLLDDSRLGEGRWRGAITPGCDLSDLNALDRWFESYSLLILKYARIAYEEQAYGIVIGTEFVSIDKQMDKYTQRWNMLIDSVRLLYRGQVAYAKNWNPDDLPGFVNSLDVLMIDAFYDLRGLPDHATEEQIYQAWRSTAAYVIQEYQRQLDIPIMFAEVGMVPRVGSYRAPWNSNNGAEPDWEGQFRYYLATCRFVREMQLDGMFWWAIGFYDHYENGFQRYLREDFLGYSFYDFPAENAVRECYQS